MQTSACPAGEPDFPWEKADLRIRDVISPTLGIRSEEPSGLTLERMRAMGVEHLIVTGREGIQGVVSETDVSRACSVNPDTPVGELAVDVPIVDSEALVQEAASLMRLRKVGCLPVVDGLTLAGVVTIERLLELIAQGAVHNGKRHK